MPVETAAVFVEGHQLPLGEKSGFGQDRVKSRAAVSFAQNDPVPAFAFNPGQIDRPPKYKQDRAGVRCPFLNL